MALDPDSPERALLSVGFRSSLSLGRSPAHAGPELAGSEKGQEAVTQTRQTGITHLAIVLIGLCLAATAAISKEPKEVQEAQEAEEVAGEGNGGVAEREFPVPNRPRSNRPEGDPVELDTLLHLPSGFGTRTPKGVAGASESEWRRRFSKADRELAEARRSLDKTKKELEEVAVAGGGSQWSIAPPGGGGGGGDSSSSSSPMSFKLRQKLREDRELIEEGERALRELRIEADLAGVPQAWRALDSGSPESAEPRPELN